MKKVFLILLCCLYCVLISACAPHEHNVEKWNVEKPATCKETGIETGVCTECGETQSREIAKLPHTEGDWVIEQKATPSHSGIRKKYCKICNSILKTDYYYLSNEEKVSWLKLHCEKFNWLNYDGLERRPNSYQGTYAKFKCKILQVISESTSRDYYSSYRVAMDGETNCPIYLCIDNYGSYSRIVENDTIIVYGYFDGLKTYNTVLGASKTIPKFIADYFEYSSRW